MATVKPDIMEALRLPFLNGVYIAIDAIAGSYLIVDGPYCAFTKAEMQYCHNLRCRLIPQSGPSRIVHTGQAQVREEVSSLSTDRARHVESVFARVCARPDAQLVLASSFDFHELQGFPLREIARRCARTSRALVCHVPSRSLGGTWRDGYALTCAALAGALDLKSGRGEPDAVAVVGHLHDRDEPDQAGDLRELRRLLGALGLRAVSIWLSGKGRAELEAAARARLVVSLPYARAAARLVARRLRARLCEVDLPLGLAATERFLLKVGAQAGRGAAARRFAAQESAAVVRDTEPHVLRLIAGRRCCILHNDPELAARLRELCAELGLVSEEPGLALASDSRAVGVRFAPTMVDFPLRDAWVPMGYPNYLEHPVAESPSLGYAGFRRIVGRVADAVLRAEAARNILPEPATRGG
jgi:hypothetical protein